MDDDFNTPETLSVLFDLAREVNRLRESDTERARVLAGELRALGAVLGLLDADPEAYLRGCSAGEGPGDDEIEAMIAKRADARARKDWAEADRCRDSLAAAGIVLEDGGRGHDLAARPHVTHMTVPLAGRRASAPHGRSRKDASDPSMEPRAALYRQRFVTGQGSGSIPATKP